MPSDPTKNQSYSVDEMMERLREGEREKRQKDESELVTREDGTQVLKVRKRKRRSSQKGGSKKKRRQGMGWFKWLPLILLPLLLVFGTVILLARYHSPSFERRLAATAWERARADVSFKQLTTLPTQVGARSMEAKWPNGFLLEKLKVENLKAPISLWSFYTGQWSGDELSSEKGVALFSLNRDRKTSKPEVSGFGFKGFDRYTCRSLTLMSGSETEQMRLAGTSATFTNLGEGLQEVLLNGGSLRIPSWGTWPVNRGTVRIHDDGIELVSLMLRDKDQEVVVSADLPTNQLEKEFLFEIKSARLDKLAGSGLGRFFEGMVEDREATIVLQGWDFSSHQFNLEQISLARVKIQNFPFLKALDEMYGDSKYLKAAEFSSGCSLNLRRGKNWCELRNLELRETGFLGLRGDLFVKGNELSGQLEVGLPDHRTLLIRSKNRDELLANAKQEGGYFWIPVEVSGTPNAPQDNFASFVSTPQGASSGAGGVFDQLTR